MAKLYYTPLPTKKVRALQRGGLDAYGLIVERQISDGSGIPCRHCLANIVNDDEYLILSYSPFTTRQPYAEQGPIFLHAKECAPYKTTKILPAMYKPAGILLLRGYNEDERIVYGTGQIAKNKDIATIAADIFRNPDVAFIHARSASNNCFQFKIEKGGNNLEITLSR